MRACSVQYSYEPLKEWGDFEKKIEGIIQKLSTDRVTLALFPEYLGWEVASFFPNDPNHQWDGVASLLPKFLELFQRLSKKHEMYLCAGTTVFKEAAHFFNRAYFFSPEGTYGYQDKICLTIDELEEGKVAPGKQSTIFLTPFGVMGIAICYDSEFPVLVRRLIDAGAEIILIPSYTSTPEGYTRVHISARARAIENQCYTIQSCLVGKAPWFSTSTVGCGGIFTPADTGFPEDAILAKGKWNKADCVIGDLSLEKLYYVREKGQVRNFEDWKRFQVASPINFLTM